MNTAKSKLVKPGTKKAKKGTQKVDVFKGGFGKNGPPMEVAPAKGREKMAKTPRVSKPMKPKKKKAPSPGMK